MREKKERDGTGRLPLNGETGSELGKTIGFLQGNPRKGSLGKIIQAVPCRLGGESSTKRTSVGRMTWCMDLGKARRSP